MASRLRTEQGVHVAFLGAVGMYLDENPLRPPLHMDTRPHPGIHPWRRGWTGAAHVGVLDARNHAETALAPVQPQRSLHDHQVAAGLAADPNRFAGVVRFRSLRVVGGVVDRIDHAGLRIAGGGGQGEVGSIAATTTRAGLTVHAELDPGSYPTGTEISDAQMAEIPLARHRFHGDWNYTLRPHPAAAPGAGAAGPGRFAGEVPDRAVLSHPALTGMSRQRLEALIAELAAPQEAQREQARSRRRGAERRRAAGAGPRPRLTGADRILATVLYLRRLCTQAVLAELFAVDRSRITEAVRETRPLMEEYGHAVTPATARFPAPADLAAFLTAENNDEPATRKPTC